MKLRADSEGERGGELPMMVQLIGGNCPINFFFFYKTRPV